MAQYIDKDKVIEYIKKRLIPTVNHGNIDDWERGADNERINFLLYINTLPEEPASEDLEEEINRVDDWYPVESKYIQEIAHHFAEWQKQQDEKLFKDDSWNYIEENYPNITQEEKLRLYDISIKSRLAGANAIKQKMMKDAVDATILDIDAQTIEFGLWPEKLLSIKEGDKVKIIVIKEN